MQTYDIIFSSVLAAVAIALTVLWYLRQREYGRAIHLLTGNGSKAIVSHALKELNVKAKWTKDKENHLAHYTYQGGHFNILLEKGSPFARLSFLFFFQADVDDIETVRVVCNLCNLNTDACRIVYTVDDKGGKVDVHLISVLPVQEKGMKEMLERVMSDAFRWQNTYSSRFDDTRKRAGGAGLDEEKTKAQYSRDLQLVREQEMTHQEAGPDWHGTPSAPFTLGDLISTSLGLTDIIPIRLAIAIDDAVTVVDDPDDILGYHASAPLVEGTTFAHQSAIGKLDFYDPRDSVTVRHLALDFEQEGATRDTLFYRVTMSLAPVSISSTVGEEGEQHAKQMTSVLLGMDLTPPEERQAHFRYVWKEAMAKQKAGETDKMTDEEKVLAQVQDPHLAYNYYHGRSLYLHKRFYEALRPLTDAFRTASRIYDNHDRHVLDLIEELAYFIGCCYMGLHQYDRAAYYLQLTLPTSHQAYTEAYVNCLVNGGDYRAMDVLTGLQATLQAMLHGIEAADSDDEDEDGNSLSPGREQLEKFINFVKRRRAFMLVSNGKYAEAERLLKQLLDDPDNSDFALSELAYIQGVKKSRS